MKSKLIVFFVFAALAIAFSVWAQPPSLFKKTLPGRGEKKGYSKKSSGNTPTCIVQRRVLEQNKKQLEQTQSELVGIDSELNQLNRRIKELSAKKVRLVVNVRTLNAKVGQTERSYKEACEKNENCEQYESLASNLDQQGDEIQKELEIVRQDIRKSRSDMSQLKRQIEPLRQEYSQKKCNDLVPGETSQSTIDRCSQLFSDWNRLQTRLNQLNQRLPLSKSRYEKLYSQLKSVDGRAQTYEKYLTKNCKKSKKVHKLKAFNRVRKNAEDMGKELDNLIDEVSKMREIEITISL